MDRKKKLCLIFYIFQIYLDMNMQKLRSAFNTRITQLVGRTESNLGISRWKPRAMVSNHFDRDLLRQRK